MNKKFRAILTVLIILVFVIMIFYPKIKPLFSSKGEGGPAPAGQMMRGPGAGSGQPVLNVSGFLIAPAQMNEVIKSSGTVLPDEEVELSFETSGKIVAIYFTEGTRVKKGDLLAKVNDKPLQAQLLKLQAQKKLAEEKEFRQRSLLEKDAISRESYDQIATELQAIEADVLLIQARIAETELRAPFDGIIGLRLLSEGSYTSPSTKIVRLVKTSPLKIEFSIAERYANEIRKGFPIEFEIDGNSTVFRASVYAVDPKVDINTRTIGVRAMYPNSREELKPGRFASITMRLTQIENTIAIPTEAIIPEMEGEKVFLYKAGKAFPVAVATGLRTEALIQIKEGLQFGDTLLTSGVLQLRQGLPVVLDTLVKN
ncbi:MAG: efflux RND transporter periplasmic adaptor subunit [Bacteroidales bacterium]|nr:efflux RND transporter periplasmic adaptor subunit [Bacteroidales bacterium]